MSNRSSGKWTLILLLLFSASIILNIYQWSNKKITIATYEKKVNALETRKTEIDNELNNTYAELNQYRGINSRLDSLLQEANGKVNEQKARIDKLLRTASGVSSLNKSLEEQLHELRSLKSQYLSKIDSVLNENQQLKKEKTELTVTVDTLSKNLQTTLNAASVLKAEYFKVNAYRFRNKKYSETATAKRTNKIEACVTIMDNPVAQSGERTIIMRLIAPNGKVAGNPANGSSSFKKNDRDEELLYTASQKIQYNNQKQDVCLSYEEKEHLFEKGNYQVEIYIDGSFAGATALILK